MTVPTTTSYTLEASQEATATSIAGEQSVLTQSAVTIIDFSRATFAGSADVDDDEDFYEEIDEDEDHEATEAPDLPEEEPEDGRGQGQPSVKGAILVKSGNSKPNGTK